jgi:biopolymer transport protein ExbD
MEKYVKRKRKYNIRSEINITPLTDVSLMLLSIFMLTTPLLVQSGLNIELPKVKSAQQNLKESFAEVIIDKEGNITIDNQTVSPDVLKSVLKTKLDKNENLSVIIKADKNVRYEYIMKVIDFSKQAGIKKIALGVETEI